MGDGDDATHHPEILAPPGRTVLDAALDLVEAGLDGLGFGEQLFRPAVVVGLREFGLAGLQPLDLGLLAEQESMYCTNGMLDNSWVQARYADTRICCPHR